jgi:hypothetical protein
MRGKVRQAIPQDHAARKLKWSADEDEKLKQAVGEFGTGSWNAVCTRVPGRNGKQCRERWIGQLAPYISKENWLPEEDAALLQAQTTAGNQWSLIAAQLPGRSSISVKNRWNWLRRNFTVFGQRITPVHLIRLACQPTPDVIEKQKPSALLMEPLVLDDGLFGSKFHEFQVRMFT